MLPGEWFERIDAAAPRLDLAYFETVIGAPAGWTAAPCGYLAFGTTYAAEAAFARESGWPVQELPGHHLWHLTHPGDVAAALEQFLTRVRGSV